MNLTVIIMGIVGVLAVITSFILGWKSGKDGEGCRWYEAWNTQSPIKFKNRLYEVKKANVEEFIDE